MFRKRTNQEFDENGASSAGKVKNLGKKAGTITLEMWIFMWNIG